MIRLRNGDPVKRRAKDGCSGYIVRFGVIMVTVFACIAVAQTPGNGDSHRLINENPDPNGEPWIAGGITEEEWQRSIEGMPLLVIKRRPGVRAPAKVDNSVLPAFRPIFKQEGGSCAQASSIAYVFTYEINTIRGLASNVPENQYPYDFTYNFLNNGSGDNGSMPADGYAIAVSLGIPDVKTYGGFGLGKNNQWISGYDIYFNGMANRADAQFTLSSNTVDGVNAIRSWFSDHGDGSSQGGCFVFCYNATGCKMVTLASGTPEGGKKAMVKGGTDGGHAVTLAGYNDSVRYDYNGDGKYTNNQDANSDGKVDVKDWEIGAYIMVNSWGTSYGNSGKIYVPYRFGADGSMWSGKVYGMRTGENYVKPQLTYKVIMSHSDRQQIRIRAGYANSASATSPSGTPKTFGSAFNYVGGKYPMQGVNTDPIEIGLDVSDFIPKLTGSEAALFLVIDSKGGAGSVKSFSLIDYTAGSTPVEVVCSQQNVNLPTGTTTLKIVKTMSKLMVLTPNGGEKWERDRTFPVTWFSRLGGNVKIELLKGGTTVSTIIASTLGDTGLYQWKIPAGVALGADYTIRVSSLTDASTFDVSDKAFSIGEKSTLVLSSPNGGEFLVKGKSATVIWDDNIASNVKIDLYKNKIFDAVIAANVPSNGSYTWDIPENLPSGFEYTLHVTSVDNEWLYDESDEYFGIINPIVAVPYTQNFDVFADTVVSGYWEQGDDDDLNWTIWKGPTPSKVPPYGCGTGPDGDHTSGSGKFAYIEASNSNHPAKTGVLLTPTFNVASLTDIQISFWCHMLSVGDSLMGELWVDVNVDGIWKDSLLYLTNDHGDAWFEKSISIGQLSPRPKLMQVCFRAKTGAGYASDICIDDFKVNGTVVSVSTASVIGRVRPGIALSGARLKVCGIHGTITVFTLNGARVLRVPVAGNQTVDISMLPRGIYLAKAGGELLRFVR